MSDRLHDTLSALRTDVDSTPLADSSVVRARGNQRTRRQAVGTALAVVALIAGAVGIGGALTGNNNAEAPLPATKPAIGPEMLLTVDDLPTIQSRTFFLHETLAGDRRADAAQRKLTVCGQPPAGGTTPKRSLLRTFPSNSHDGSMWQWVAQYADSDAAQKAFTELESGCPLKPGNKQPVANGLPQGATGFQASSFTVDANSNAFADVTGVTRHGDAVVVLGLSAYVPEAQVDLDAFDAAVIVATERIASRLTPADEETLGLAADPFLRESDVTAVGPFAMLRAPDSTDGLAQKKDPCMPDIATLGAAQTKGQFFYSDLDGTFSEYVLRFDSTETAAAASVTLGQALQNCPAGDASQQSVVKREPEAVSSTGLHGSRLTTPVESSEPYYFELGITQEQNVLVVLQWSSNGNPEGNAATDWVWDANRLGTALKRALGG
jgi:hypothetical protein